MEAFDTLPSPADTPVHLKKTNQNNQSGQPLVWFLPDHISDRRVSADQEIITTVAN